MNKCLIITSLILGLTACNSTPTVVPLSPPANLNSPTMIPATLAPQEVIPTTMIQATPTIVGANTPEALWLQVLSPLDETVVNTSQLDVSGSAPAGAVISVNDEILIVGPDMQFKTIIVLDEGPNLIEIIASDESGNEISELLIVTYEP